MKTLKDISTLPAAEYSKEACKKGLKEYREKLFALQNLFYANSNSALLIILQGPDTSGKDGTIRHVMTCMNPQGVRVKSFKKPTEEELQHDYLWRVYPHIPGKGMVQVFNRSYYEDIIVPMVEKTLPEGRPEERMAFINNWEQHLVRNGIHLLKFFLHISPEKQQEKIRERQLKPHKQWKYSREDKNAGRDWNATAGAYELVINNCNNPEWNIIPADKKWYRNYAVAKKIAEYLESLELKYPKSGKA